MPSWRSPTLDKELPELVSVYGDETLAGMLASSRASLRRSTRTGRERCPTTSPRGPTSSPWSPPTWWVPTMSTDSGDGGTVPEALSTVARRAQRSAESGTRDAPAAVTVGGSRASGPAAPAGSDDHKSSSGTLTPGCRSCGRTIGSQPLAGTEMAKVQWRTWRRRRMAPGGVPRRRRKMHRPCGPSRRRPRHLGSRAPEAPTDIAPTP